MKGKAASPVPPWYESNLIWSPLAIAAGIILTLIGALKHDMRWLLWVAWPCFGVTIWWLARRTREVVLVSILGITVAGAFLLWLGNWLGRSEQFVATPSSSTLPPSENTSRVQTAKSSPELSLLPKLLTGTESNEHPKPTSHHIQMPQPPQAATPKVLTGSNSVDGGMKQGNCGVIQLGGSGNVAAPNCGPIERHLTEGQKTALAAALKGKQVKINFGYLINVPDAQQFAVDLCNAVKEALPSTSCDEVWAMVDEGGSHSPWAGFSIVYKGEKTPEGQRTVHSPDSPVGIVINAFIAAGLDKGVGHADPNMKDGEVTIIVGVPPKP